MTRSFFPAKVQNVLLFACLALGPAALSAPAGNPDSSTAKPVGRWQDASVEDYRKHLVTLQSLTEVCAKARDVKTCDPTLVGPDECAAVPVTDRVAEGLLSLPLYPGLTDQAVDFVTAQMAELLA